ncbi:MAG: mannose-1-phosphate guanylyltransferase/mannose-6-phosphate isomerase [Proteobacteria bacterium]|nr:mannose-1-phosphate guanylyltransferase/mannose-6-phosphate isomerase [Pseudomonadota bacterium]
MPKKRVLKKNNVYATILAGGIGSRFWPLSRVTTPKQVLKVIGEESLLKATIKRLSPLIPPRRVYIVTSESQAHVIKDHLRYDGAPVSSEFIIEPEGKNTAPAIGLAALELSLKDPEAVMVVLPSDHVIKEAGKFKAALGAAILAAEKGHLVTFGIEPTSPETGYGYIKASAKRAVKIDGFSVRPVDRFVEKPNLSRAKRYLKDGGYYWNSGIFVWKAARFLQEVETHLPGLYKTLMKVKEGGDLARGYKSVKPISIDHGILEHADDVVVIPVDFSWSDMGSWTSFGDLLPADARGNVIKGRVVDLGSSNSILVGSDRLLATIGVEEMIVVDTPDATLVCPKSRAQEVKDAVDVITKKGYSEHSHHVTTKRPWGFYTVLESGNGYKIKKIVVNPGARLSLQSHKKRSEHWVVITGVARVTRGEEVVTIKVNESTYIPRGVKHRLENRGKVPLEIIEVSSGGYIEEDDIVRYDDDFERS